MSEDGTPNKKRGLTVRLYTQRSWNRHEPAAARFFAVVRGWTVVYRDGVVEVSSAQKCFHDSGNSIFIKENIMLFVKIFLAIDFSCPNLYVQISYPCS